MGNLTLAVTIGTLVTAEFLIILVLSALQRNAPRLYAALVFSTLTVLHDTFFGQLDGLSYFLTAAATDLAIVIILSGIHPAPRQVVALQKLSLLSIFLNAFGFVAWFMYLPPLPYTVGFALLYAWAIYILYSLDGIANGLGGFTSAEWRSCFRYNRSVRLNIHTKNDD